MSHLTPLHGWRGRVLHVDLTAGTSKVEALPPAVLKRVLGGRGLAGWLLAPHAARDWRDPESPVVLAAGPLTAGVLPMAGRAVIAAKSPLTKTIRLAPAGGRLASALLRAGVDAVAITGQAEAPVSLNIHSEEVTFLNGGRLMDLDVCARLEAMAHPKRAVVCAGPAAHRGSSLATLFLENGRAAPGGGLGLALAAKGCAAITVDGASPLVVNDGQAVMQMRRAFHRSINASPALAGATGMRSHGDGVLYDLLQHRRMLPTRNFRETWFETQDPMGALAYVAALSQGCTACPIACGQEDGEGLLPDLAAMAGFSALVGNSQRALVISSVRECQAQGLDAWEAAAAIARHLEATGEEASEPNLAHCLQALTHGDALDGGQEDAAAAMQVKGMALPPMDPRGAWGLALALAVHAQGPDADACAVWHQELLRKPVPLDRLSWSGKARMVARGEDMAAVAQSLGLCSHALLAIGLEELTQALRGVTGWAVAAGELAACGESIIQQERAFHCAAGFDAGQDDLPQRFFTETAGGTGDAPLGALDRDAFLQERAKYYRIRGWGLDGRPAAV